jgi:hypothetical protein
MYVFRNQHSVRQRTQKKLFSKKRWTQKKTAMKGGKKYNKTQATPVSGMACRSILSAYFLTLTNAELVLPASSLATALNACIPYEIFRVFQL